MPNTAKPSFLRVIFCSTKLNSSWCPGGMKLDVLTFVAFQAPISFVPLFIFMVQSWQPGVWAALQALGFGAPNFGNKARQRET